MIIIIGVGHNSKAHAISYMPFVLGSIIYVIRKRYLLGFFLTTIFLGLQLTSNHFQMTYYLMFIVIIMAIWFIINCIKEKDFNHFKRGRQFFDIEKIDAATSKTVITSIEILFFIPR